jgi:hypothetical protein
MRSIEFEDINRQIDGSPKMAQFTTLFRFLLVLSHLVIALPPAPPNSKFPIQTIYEFPNETWVENIAVRSSGKLLVTTITSPSLHQIDPFSSAPASLIHSFPHAKSALGIAEIQPDIFAVITGNWSTETFSTTNGSYSLWKIDLTGFECDDFGRDIAIPDVTKIADIPEASFLNGLTLAALSSPYLLAADSGLGVVWSINHYTGEYRVVLENELLKPASGQITVLGINGLHTREGYLYFTNSFQYIFARVPISPQGTATGPYEVVANIGLADDFAFDKDGNAYITQDPGDALEQVNPAGKVTVLAGNTNSTVLEGDTAAAFGRTKQDGNTLYVVTNGGIAGRPAGSSIVGGKVLAVDIPELLRQHQGR